MVEEGINIAVGLKSRSKKEELAIDNPGHFHEYCFKQKLAKFHWEMIDMALEGYKDPLGPYGMLLVLAPRDHGKTSIYAETFHLWRIGKDNTVLCQIISSTSTLAELRVRKIKSCIQHNERYKNLFGNLYPDSKEFIWRDDAIEVKRDRKLVWQEEGSEERDPTVAAFGITTNVEGGRATDQVYDDIVSMENSRTPTSRKSISDKVWMAFDPMLLPDGVSRFIGTRYYPQDFYAELMPKLDTDRLYTDLYPPEEAMEMEAIT